MIITLAGQTVTIPVTTVQPNILYVSLSRAGNTYRANITATTEYAIMAEIPTDIVAGDYNYIYGMETGILRINTPQIADTTYGDNYSVIEYAGGRSIEPEELIDDTETSLTKTYSSHKIQNELDGKADSGSTYNKSEVDELISDINSAITRIDETVSGKQDTLISGENIKTLNGEPLLGEGDIQVSVDAYTKAETDTLLADKADVDNVYDKEQIDAFLSEKADTATTYTKEEVDELIEGVESGNTQDSEIIAEAVVRNRNKILTKQDVLVGGLNIKNVNGESIVGSGNIDLVTPLQLDARSNQYYRRSTIDSAHSVISEALHDLRQASGNTYTKAETDALLDGKADSATTYTKVQVDGIAALKANVEDVYDKDTINDFLNEKADVDDVYTKSQVYTKTETDTKLGAKANTATTYNKTDIDTFLAEKVNSSDVYIKSEITAFLLAKADTATTYTKAQVDALIAALPKFRYQIVEGLPQTGEEMVIYLVRMTDPTEQINTFDEYLWIVEEIEGEEVGKWEFVGSTAVDLSDYYTKVEANGLFRTKADSYSQDDVDGLLEDKQDTLESGTNIKTINGESVLGSGDIEISGGMSEEDESVLTESVVRNHNKILTKQDVLVGGLNIKNVNGESIVGGGNVDLVTPTQLDARSNQYYRRSTIDTSDSVISEALYDLKQASGYTKSQIDTMLARKANTATTYSKTDVNNLIEECTSYEILSQADYDGMGEGRDGRRLFFIDNSDDKGIVKIYIGDNDTNIYNKLDIDHLLSQKVGVGEVYSKSQIDTALAGKQATLVSGTNIKSIDGTSLLGSGDIAIDKYTKDEVDAIIEELNGEIAGKQPELISGTNIKTINSGSILGSGNINLAAISVLTQAEYNALTVKDNNTLYIISDANE